MVKIVTNAMSSPIRNLNQTDPFQTAMRVAYRHKFNEHATIDDSAEVIAQTYKQARSQARYLNARFNAANAAYGGWSITGRNPEPAFFMGYE